MSLSYFVFWLVLGVLAISLLLWVIVSQLKKDRQRATQLQEMAQQREEGRSQIIESINILLKVVGSEELGWIEASIRIKNLLDQLSIDLSDHDQIYVFYKVYDETEHIPTHDAWIALPKDAKISFRKALVECEEKYKEDLEVGKKALQAYSLA